jgi:hypothetical protein
MKRLQTLVTNLLELASRWLRTRDVESMFCHALGVLCLCTVVNARKNPSDNIFL